MNECFDVNRGGREHIIECRMRMQAFEPANYLRTLTRETWNINSTGRGAKPGQETSNNSQNFQIQPHKVALA